MKNYRKLTAEEISLMKSQMCTATDWDSIEVADGFKAEHVRHCRFSGRIRIGRSDKIFSLPGGMEKPSGLYYATLHNVTVGDDC